MAQSKAAWGWCDSDRGRRKSGPLVINSNFCGAERLLRYYRYVNMEGDGDSEDISERKSGGTAKATPIGPISVGVCAMNSKVS